MKLLKLALAGVAGVFAFKYATKKRESDGKSLVDDLSEQAPQIADKVKAFGEQIKDKYKSAAENF